MNRGTTLADASGKQRIYEDMNRCIFQLNNYHIGFHIESQGGLYKNEQSLI